MKRYLIMYTGFIRSAAVITMTLFLFAGKPLHAQYIIKEADASYELFNYNKAIVQYKKAYEKKQTLHAAERLGSSYQMIRNFKEAENWYAIAVNMPGSLPANRLNYAIALQNNSKYREAKVQYKAYGALNPAIPETQKLIWSSSCDSAIHWLEKPNQKTLSNVPGINSRQSDWGAVIYQGGLVFSSDRPNPTNRKAKERRPFLKFDGPELPDKKSYGWTGNGYLNLYVQKEGTPVPALFPLKTEGLHISSAGFSADENEVYFTMTRIPENPVYQNGIATINLEIYSSKKNDQGNWLEPAPFIYNNVSSYSMGDPYLNADGSKLYFTSNMPGGKGGTDIYYSLKDKEGQWGQPVNLAEINTAGNERSPFLDQNGSLYFSSDGRIGMGGLDIYVARMSEKGYSDIQNLGAPVNSPQDDFCFRTENKSRGLFSSNRPGGLGEDDIYRYTENPKVIFNSESVVYQKDSAIRKDIDPDETSKKRHFSFNPIYYNFNETKLRPDAAFELDKLALLLKNNPALSIALTSHADHRGSLNYNLLLSQRRAHSAVQYLTARGINRSRILAYWYGDLRPLVLCDKTHNCSEEMHQINRRTEFDFPDLK